MPMGSRAGARDAMALALFGEASPVPAVRERVSFTSVCVASAYREGARREGGWEFATMPGFYIGIAAGRRASPPPGCPVIHEEIVRP